MENKDKRNNQVDVIIPAYKAHSTILRTLSSIATQTIIDDVNVIIVNDASPEGSYQDFVDMFSPFMKVKEVVLDVNGGPGVARQKGIEAGTGEFFTCIDADDTFSSAIALEMLREGIKQSDVFQACIGTFLQLGENLQMIVPHMNDMVWMFGKLYRREFIDRYKIKFNETRANEDTGFNTWVRLLCTNQMEQIRFIQEPVYYWHNKEGSITRINDGQYGFDQCMCGWTDNMIHAIKQVQKVRPFNEAVSQQIVNVMLQLYYYHIETKARKPVYLDQNWEFTKKFYHECYQDIEKQVTDELFSEMYSLCSREKWGSGSMLGIIPHIGIKEFMDKVRNAPYDPDDIYKVWARMPADLVENNITCGVSPANYWKRPEYVDVPDDVYRAKYNNYTKKDQKSDETKPIWFFQGNKVTDKNDKEHYKDEEIDPKTIDTSDSEMIMHNEKIQALYAAGVPDWSDVDQYIGHHEEEATTEEPEVLVGEVVE